MKQLKIHLITQKNLAYAGTQEDCVVFVYKMTVID
jgi:hypothetical protein